MDYIKALIYMKSSFCLKIRNTKIIKELGLKNRVKIVSHIIRWKIAKNKIKISKGINPKPLKVSYKDNWHKGPAHQQKLN